MNLVLLAFVIAPCGQPIRCQLLTFPMNIIANFGQRVALDCSANLALPLRWDFAAVHSTRFEDIYITETITRKFSSRYKVDTARSGHWTLVIDSADMSHAGTYRCLTTPNYPIGEKEISVSAQLIVIDSDPICGTNASSSGLVEGDYMRMWCTFNYSGNWIPVMKWTRNIGQTVEFDIHYTYESSKVALWLVTEMTSSDNGATFKCKLSFSPDTANSRPAKVGETQATNIAHYQYSWNYAAHVLYGPRNQTILLIDDPLKIGSRMECFAEGNPAPSYEWELVGKNISLGKGSVIVISKSMVSDEEQTLRCTATNSVAGQIRSNETTFTFNLTDGTEYSARATAHSGKFKLLLIIGIIVCALIFCMVFTMIIYKICRKGNPVNRNCSQEASIQQQDYEMVDELNMNSGDFGVSSLNKSTPNEPNIELHSPEYGGYSSLKRSSSATIAQPAVYAQLHLYANTNFNDS